MNRHVDEDALVPAPEALEEEMEEVIEPAVIDPGVEPEPEPAPEAPQLSEIDLAKWEGFNAGIDTMVRMTGARMNRGHRKRAALKKGIVAPADF